MKNILVIIIGIVGFSSVAFAQFADELLSIDLAPSPSNGNCLTTDGTINIWGVCGTGGSSVSDWLQANGALTPTTSIGIRVKASSTITGLTVDGNSTTTGKLIVQGTGTSTFGGGVQLGLNQHLVAHGAISDGSDGFHIDANNGTVVGLFGAGNSANSLFYGGVNIDGATRLATSLNGFAYLTNGAVTATTSGASLTLARIGNSTYSTLQDLQNIFHSAGYISGGLITDAGSGNVSVATGTGLIRSSNIATATISYFDWTASSSINVPTNSYRYIGVEYNAGSPRIVSHTTYDWNFKTDFPLGNVVNTNGITHIESSPFAVGDHAANMIRRDVETMPYERDMMMGGLILGETGTRNITVSAGAVWQGLTRFEIPAIDTSATDSFTTWAYNGTSWNATTSVTQWPNTQYNNIASGLVTMTNNRYANLWFYRETDGGLHVLYGQAEHATLAGAEAEAPPSLVPDKITVHSWLIGRLIFQKSASVASQVDSVYTTVFSASSASDHANLSNLAWTSSGHTGTASRLAGFNGAGVASEYATSTPSVTAPITYSGTLGYLVGGSSGSFGCTTANTTTLGCLTSGDWNIFNNKLASTSIDTSAELAAILTDETGTGNVVFSASPVFTGGTAFTGIKVSASSTLGLASSTALTVSGQTYLGLASTTAISGTNLNFTNATSSASFQTPLLGIGTDYISDITGSGLTLTNGVLSATASGGGSSNWLTVAGKLTPSTTIGINVPTASSMGSTTYSGSLLLASNDGGQLGALGTAWGDLFLASGGVINWNNSDVTITHAGNALTFAGASSGFTFNNDIITSSLLDVGGGALEIPNGTAPTVDSVGEIAIDTTSNQLVLYGSAKKVYGDGNFYPSFTYATSTAWTGTTTIPLGAPFTGETWGAVKCFTDTGTVNVDFGDGTNWMNATTSKALNPVPTHTLSTNNTFTAGETRYARVGTPVSSPTKISCTLSKTITSD